MRTIGPYVIEPCLMCGSDTLAPRADHGAVVCDGCDGGLDDAALDLGESA